MSRRKRPASHYVHLAERLSRTNPTFAKYAGRDPKSLSPQEKAAISRAAYRQGIASPQAKRTDESYIESARNMAKFVPVLRKYRHMHKKRTKLTNQQKAVISHFENLLRYAHHLIAVSDKQAKKLKDLLFAPGVQAIQLDHTNDHAKMRLVKKDLLVVYNGRVWLYWRLPPRADAIKKGAKKAFEEPRITFPIEEIVKLVEKAFKRPTTREVYLWAASGRVGAGYQSLKQFLRWFNRSYGGYTEQQKWVRGIAIRLGDPPAGQQKTSDDYEETDYEDDEIGDDE